MAPTRMAGGGLRVETFFRIGRCRARHALIAVGCMMALGAGLCACLPRAQAADAPASELAAYYGFGPLEIYKLQARTSNLLAADFNQDGLIDLLSIDNSNSRLDLLQQRREAPARVEKPPVAGRVNAIEDDWRFEHKKIAVDRAVSALASGDFNDDGRRDLVYVTPPDQLVVRLQAQDADFSKQRRIRVPEILGTQWSIAAGDLNGDGKDDVVVLGKNTTYVLYQQQGELSTAFTRLMNTSESLGLVQIADLDGDGRNDLSYLVSDDAERPFAARLQDAEGRLGPEIRCELPKYRGVTWCDVDRKPGVEVLSIEAQTGRVRVQQLQRPQAQPGELAGQLVQYGLGQQGAGRNRDLALGDINHDGLTDVVVTDPETAQMFVFLQRKGTGLDQGTAYPGLAGADEVRIGDVDGDGKAEVIVLSPKEKTLGLSRMTDGRLTFPEAIITEKEPIAFELGRLGKDQRTVVMLVGRERGSTVLKYTLQALSHEPTKWKVQMLRPNVDHVALNVKSTPERLVALDANRDGLGDYLLFLGGDRPPVTLLQSAEGGFQELANDGGFGLGTVSPGGLFVGSLDRDRPVVLTSQNNFARSVEVDANRQWRVTDQYNAAEPDAKIAGAAAVDLDLQPGNEIVLIDLGVRKLRILRRDGQLYVPWREVDVGAFPFKSAHVADLNADGHDDLLIFGGGKFGVLYAGQSDPQLKLLSSYETKLENVHINDLAAGDLNHDGEIDVALVDTRSQFVDLLDYAPSQGLRHALAFKVFEAKSISGAEQNGLEPRECVIADVTGDGKADLILLSHDRILVYPQDNGEPAGDQRATAAP